MADLSVTNTFNAGDTVTAAKFNTNYTTDIAAYINARNDGSTSWDGFRVTRSGGVPLTVNNSTGTSSIAQFKDNGTTVFEVFDGGIIKTAKQSAIRLQKSTNVDISSGSITLISPFLDPSLSSLFFDLQSEADFSSGRITVLKSGKYFISPTFQLIVIGDTSITFDLFIYKNGASISQMTKRPDAVSGVINSYQLIADIINLNSGDYIEFYARIASFSGSQATVSSGTFVMHKLS